MCDVAEAMWLEQLAASVPADAVSVRERFAAFLAAPLPRVGRALTADDELRDLLGLPRAV